MAGVTPINPMFSGYPALNSIRTIELNKAGIAADEIQGIGVPKTNEVLPDAAGNFDNLLTDFVKQVDEKQQIANTRSRDY
jgi:flagellar hook-basal body complex protein FliE